MPMNPFPLPTGIQSLVLMGWLGVFSPISAADYYVDPSGNDANSGNSSALPWKSLSKVNSTVFLPGDRIFFKRGGTWYGTLSPQGSGNSSSQITLSSYGTGAKPLIDGGGNWAAIALSSQEYWTIDGFEVTNPGSGDASRSGIRIDASGSQTTHRLRILNNDVRDVRGIRNVNDGARNCGGIFIWINEPGKADDVLIQGNTVTNVYGQGINFAAEAEYMGGGMNYNNCSPNVVVRGNTVLTTSGDGILLLGTDNELAEFNEVGYCGALSADGNNIAAAWPTRHVNGVWQYNYIHNSVDRGNDSTAFDNDGFVKGTTYFQYNQTYNNQGGFFMEYTWGGDSNPKSVVRYNISVNESRVVATNRAGALFYNNVFYNPGGTFGAEWTSSGVNAIFYNNIFWGTGYWGTFASQAFSYNTFFGGMGAVGTFSASRDPGFANPNVSGDMSGFILSNGSSERNSGLAISANGGKDFWGAPVPASPTSPHRGASQIANLGVYNAIPTFLRVSAASYSATIPTGSSNTVAFQAVVRDQNFRQIFSPAVTWSISPAASGYAIDANGVLTISSGAAPQRLAVVATSGALSNNVSISTVPAPADSTWGQSAGGNWSEPANWQSSVIANGTDKTAIFNLAGDIMVSQDFTSQSIGHLSFGAGNFTLAGNALTLDVTSGAPTASAVAGAGATIACVLNGNDGLTKLGDGTLRLAGANSYTGATTVSAGTLSLTGGQLYSNLGWGDQTVRIHSGAVLEADRWDGGGCLGQLGYNQANLVLDGGTIRYLGNTNRTDEGPGFTIDAGGATLESAAPVGQIWNINHDGRSASYGISSSNGGTLTLSGSGNGLFSKLIPGNGGLVKTGSGTWTLSAANGHSGGTSVNAGTLRILNSSALGSGITTVTSGGKLLIDSDNLLLANAIILNGTTPNGAVATGNLTAGQTTVLTGTIRLNSTSNLGCWWNDKTLELRGKITGAGGLDLVSSSGICARFLISGSNNDYQGNTSVTGANVNYPSILVLGAENALPTGGALTLNQAQLHLGGHSQALSRIEGTGSYSVLGGSGASATLTLGVGNASSSFGGTMTGNVALAKVGSGTLTLAGTNSHTGGTTVDGGTLVVDSSGTLGSGSLTVNTGAICELRSASAFAEASALYLNGTGKLNIDSGVAVVIHSLFVDGVVQPVGTYTAATHPALIAGAGSLMVPDGTLSLTMPLARQIFQREGNQTGSVVISGTYTGTPEQIEARAVVMSGLGNNGTSTGWTTIVSSPTGGSFSGALSGVSAGGWYRIEVRMVTGGTPTSLVRAVERVGIGDVYLTAGQSNSANYGTPGTNSDDRVSAMDYTTGVWTMATDPMPGATGPDGSVWTRLGTLLTSAANVPVGFVCVGVGGTAVSYWVPPATEGYLRLKAAAQAFPPNGFRALLWHQGESDSLASTTPADYQTRLSSIIAQLRADAGWTMPWYVAEASFHPSATLAQEEPVVAGQRRVIFADPLVFAGPVTDDFHLEGKLYDSVHFNAAGLANHAQQWADVLVGTAPLAPENSDFEFNTALADGGISVVNTADVSSPSIIGWRILNATGEAVADGGFGYFNPDSSFYGAVATDTGAFGGVLPHMIGRHAAFFYGGSDRNHFLQTRRATLQANTTFSLTVALGVRGNGNTFGNARIELLADGASIASRDVTLADLNAMNGGNAANTFTDVQVSCSTGATVAAGQPLAIRITKINGQIGGNPTYLDFDHVRLTNSTTGDGVWISPENGNWSNASNWQGNIIAEGVDSTATFSQATGVTVTQDLASRTIGNLRFSHANYSISGNPMALAVTSGSPLIAVSGGGSAIIATSLSSADGLTQTGAGTLILSGNDLTLGSVALNDGTLVLDVPESHVIMSSVTVGNAKLQLNRNGTTGAADPNWWSNSMGLITIHAGGELGLNHSVAQGINHGLVLNGGSLTAVGGASNDWGHFTLNSNVTIGGGAASEIAATVALNGNPTFDVAGGSSLNVSGAFINRYQTDSGFTKTGSGTMTLSSVNSYTGNTTVNGGTLRLGNGSSSSNLADNADLIVATGAMLELDFSGTDVIDELWLDGNRMPVGVYSSASGFITGIGTLTVTNGPSSGNYAIWAGRGGYNLTGSPSDDQESDGIANLLEYVLGGNPQQPTSERLPTASTQAGNLVFSFQRLSSSAADTTQTFQYSTDMETWSNVPISAGGMVSILANTPQPGTDTVTITLPEVGQMRLFGRLRVSMP